MKNNKDKMKRRIKVKVAVFVLLLIAAMFASCSGQQKSEVEKRQTGTEGVVLEFMKNTPPSEVFEGMEFPVSVKLWNKGIFSLRNVPTVDSEGRVVKGSPEARYKGYLSMVFDPYYLEFKDITSATRSRYNPFLNIFEESTNIAAAQGAFKLSGKSEAYPEGEITSIDFLFKARKLGGQIEHPSTKLTYTLCYPYSTILNANVCIDKDYYNQEAREKVCVARDLSFSEGQGAPVAITSVEPRFVTAEYNGKRVVKPLFRIELENKGNGNIISQRVLGNLQSRNAIEDFCLNKLSKEVNTDNWYTADIEVRLLDTELECNPNPVKFFKGKASTTCTYPENSLSNLYSANPQFLPTGFQGPTQRSEFNSNFQTTLNAKLDYVYLETGSKELTINRISV